MDHSPAIGIDLGTTNSVVATVHNGQPTVIKNRAGTNLTPSVVAIAQNGKRLVGAIARRQAVTNAENTAWAVKRLIGRKFSSKQVQEALAHFTFPVVEGDHDDVRVRLAGRDYAVPELSAMVLGELKTDAEAFFGHDVSQAVITVPAYFNDGQRQATRDAGSIAGLKVLRIINEPTSAALAYGYGRKVEGKIAVFDLGGGTFDISVLDVSSGVFQVLATGGDTYLGGEDFDNRLVRFLLDSFMAEHGVDLSGEKMAMQRLREAAEKAKCELSSVKEAQVHLPFLFSAKDNAAALHLQKSIGREKLEALTADLVERCIETSKRTLEDAGVRPSGLKEVILVGGMTRMPKVADAVKRFFGRDPCKGVHPDEVVALGAAIQAQALIGGERDIEEGVGAAKPAPKPAPQPVSSPSPKPQPPPATPDFGDVALPTPAPAPAPKQDVLLLDVTPHSLGVAIAGGYAQSLIPRNTTVPTSATHLFHTSKDFQTTVKVMVLQGESLRAGENELLGEFVMTGLRSAPRGAVEIEITFDISADGIVSVSAVDTATGQRQSITVTASGGLTQEELSKIIDEQRDFLLEAHMDEEIARKMDEVQSLAAEIERIRPEVNRLVATSSFGADVLEKAGQSLERARDAVDSKNLGVLTTAHDELTRTLQVFKGVLSRLGGVR